MHAMSVIWQINENPIDYTASINARYTNDSNAMCVPRPSMTRRLPTLAHEPHEQKGEREDPNAHHQSADDLAGLPPTNRPFQFLQRADSSPQLLFVRGDECTSSRKHLGPRMRRPER